MTYQKTIRLVNKIRLRYMLARFAKGLLFATGFGLCVFALSSLTTFTELVRISVSVLAGCFFLLIRFWFYDTLRINTEVIAQHINLQYPQLEYSASLLLADDENLNRLERLQKERVMSMFLMTGKTFKIPYSIGGAMGSVLMGVVAILLFSGVKDSVDSSSEKFSTEKDIYFSSLPPQIKDFKITVSSPAYMKLGTIIQENPDLHIQEGAGVQWNIAFSDSVLQAYFIFSGNDSVSVTNSSGIFRYRRNFAESNFYHIGWIAKDGSHFASDFFSIDVTPDNPPVIEIANPPQFLDLKFDDNQQITVAALLKDDWGVTDAYLVATISKGSGENVKFREEKLLFASPSKFSGKNIDASLQIDLQKLGMEPGDELYFYVTGSDNKRPVANNARTETYFVALADTALIEWAADEGLGVDLMPEYFRSQRQIIIDTEKLIREKKAIAKPEFNYRSNELGYDQKLLRLKYGEFLGEEFESEITQGEDHSEQPDEHEQGEENPLDAYSHKHDVEAEHQEVVLDEKKKDDKEDILAAFVHNHDDSETATFFEQSIRTKLKAALAVMWDAELYLRLYEPDKSLPYQYRALKLLKEISNDSRIYVHKVGFDPPPVKEDKRLTGELKDISGKSIQWKTSAKVLYPNTRIALRLIENLLMEKATEIPEKDKVILRNTGSEMAAAILNRPSIPLKILSVLNQLTVEGISQEQFPEALEMLRWNLTRVLPEDPETIGESKGLLHPLENQFTEALERR